MFKKRLLALAVAVLMVLGLAACVDDTTRTVSVEMTIECLALIETPAAVSEQYRTVVPADGYILAETTVMAQPGESLESLLNYVAKERKLAVVSSSGYFSSIGGLSDTAVTSGYWGGWTFTVNGESPMDGPNWLTAAQYKVKEGDKIVWAYMIGAN